MDPNYEKDILLCLSAGKDKTNNTKWKLRITKSNEANQGFIGDITFATLIDSSNESHQVDIVIKDNKIAKKLRETSVSVEVCRREIMVYSTVYEAFKLLEEARNIKDKLSGIPKCLGYRITDSSEILILENLTTKGFTLWPANQPLTYAHTKIVLREFAKWHAMSFALKDQRPDIFLKFFSFWKNPTSKMIVENGFYQHFVAAFDKCILLLNNELEDNDIKELEKLKADFHCIFLESHTDDPDFSVISHGDCWNNNFMFKYKTESDDSAKVVTDVAILDWQCSAFSPPVFDVSHFLYSTSGEEQLTRIEEILQFYYEVFSSHLTALGSDPKTLYPFNKFEEQWRRYSPRGLLMGVFTVGFCAPRRPSANDAQDLSILVKNDKCFWENYIIANLQYPEEYKALLLSLVKCCLHYITK